MTPTVQVEEQRVDDVEAGGDADLAADGGAVLLTLRMLAVLSLLVTSVVHVLLALQGSPGQDLRWLFLLQGCAAAVVAMALLARDGRAWAAAVALSAAGLVGILLSVYAPVPAFGPLPAIDDPRWLLTKALCGLCQLTVVALWAIRRISPPVGP